MNRLNYFALSIPVTSDSASEADFASGVPANVTGRKHHEYRQNDSGQMS
jgi:hypothetical protein